MKICHVCNCECEDCAELCSVCGADLNAVQNETAEEEKAERIIERPVLLATLDDVVSAEILRDILNDNGIPNSSGQPNDASMKVVFGGVFVAEEIYVDSCDFEKAEELYTEFLNMDTNIAEDFFIEEEEN